MKITIFLGAGASAAENLPIQNELFYQYFKHIFSQDKESRMNRELVKFFKELFYIDVENDDIDSIHFPTFEEVLGVLDLADRRKESFKNYKSESYSNDNNTSIDYIKQCLIMLTAYSLNSANEYSNRYHELLISNLLKYDLIDDTTFISANYDIHIDNAVGWLYDNGSNIMLDYGFGFSNFNFKKNSWKKPVEPKVNLYKIHGSLNWLYCPICNSVTITPYEGGIMRIIQDIKRAKCLNCKELTVPIIVPPTYFKDMSNVYLSTVWNKSEKALRESDVLVFCGYSFPDADIHIKYLLKRVQTSRQKDNLKIIVINNHSKKIDSVKEKEKDRFKRFLGKDVIYTDYTFQEFANDPKNIIDSLIK